MCCFSRRVEHVSATSIFARSLANGNQIVAYSMSIVVGEDVAMVLPIPVAFGAGENAVRFIDLSAYPSLFVDLKKAFPTPVSMGAFGAPPAGMPQKQVLKVHDVGAFEASFVPTIADFDRLDPRFRMPRSVWDRLPSYRHFGFAVFKLRPTTPGQRQDIHPMAFEFPRHDQTSVFFPTLHVHDGDVHEVAGFDHALYMQVDDELAHIAGWQASQGPIGMYVDERRANGVIDGRATAYHVAVNGHHRNEDVVLPRSPDRASALAIATDCFRSSFRTTSAYRPIPAHHDPSTILRWRYTIRRGVAPIVAEVAREVGELERELRSQLGLVAFDPHAQFWSPTGGTVRHQFWAQSQLGEAQMFEACFAAPNFQHSVAMINERLSQAVDRAIRRFAS